MKPTEPTFRTKPDALRAFLTRDIPCMAATWAEMPSEDLWRAATMLHALTSGLLDSHDTAWLQQAAGGDELLERAEQLAALVGARGHLDAALVARPFRMAPV